MRGSKYEPLVETVDILEVNPNYAHVRLNNGRETTVSLRHIAPLGDKTNSSHTELNPMDAPIQSNTTLPPPLPSALENTVIDDSAAFKNNATENSTPLPLDNSQRTTSEDTDVLNLRRSSRIRRKPPYLAENYQL